MPKQIKGQIILKGEKKKRRVELGPRDKEILSAIFQAVLATTVVASLAALFLVFPKSPIALNFLLKQVNKKKKRKLFPSELRRNFERLKRNRLIDIKEEGDEIKMVLRREGVKAIIVNNLDQIKFERPKTWDGIWRIIIFDIPEHHKKARDALSQKLRELNFYRLQKSIFVYPYPPHEVIDFLSEIFDVSPYVRLIAATKIEGEEEILAHFDLVR